MSAPAIVFIHGLWIHASAWDPWIEMFEARGYRCTAPGWPGDRDDVAATRDDPSGMNDVGITAICRHYADAIEGMEDRPIVIGHSFGGLIAQELLAHGYAAAAIALDPAPIKGVNKLPFSQLRSGLPVLGNPANRHRTVALTAKEFRYSFGNAIPPEESDALFERWTIPGPGRPLFEDATANFTKDSPAAVDTHLADRGPLLLASGTEDHTVPLSVTRAVAKLYAKSASVTDFHVFEGRGHSLTMDAGWRDVAETCADWLESKGYAPAPSSPAAAAASEASAAAEAVPGVA